MKRRALLLAIPLMMATACAEPSASDDLDDGGPGHEPVQGLCDDADAPEDPYADCIDAFEPAPGVSFGHDAMPEIVLGPPQGAGLDMGGTHVASLGCGGSITLHFAAPWPTDQPGPDFIVFENAFRSGASTFIEPAAVLVSEDGERWHEFDCEPEGPEPPRGCAGLGPVLASGPAASLDPAAAGGDAFDLADVGLSEARWIRIIDRTAEYYGSQTWCLGAAGGFDLDAVALVESPP